MGQQEELTLHALWQSITKFCAYFEQRLSGNPQCVLHALDPPGYSLSLSLFLSLSLSLSFSLSPNSEGTRA